MWKAKAPSKVEQVVSFSTNLQMCVYYEGMVFCAYMEYFKVFL